MIETKMYDVSIKLIGNRSPCHIGHKIGDEWTFNWTTPANMCGLAFNTIYPIVLAFQYGATFPWQKEPDVITITCPDVEVNNIFEIRRKLKKQG